MEAALFSPSSLFQEAEDHDDQVADEADGCQSPSEQTFVERTHTFPGMDLKIREFSFHHLNANLLWPGTFAFCDWLVQHKSLLIGRRILELGSGTGALAIFLRKSFGVDITTSDFDDKEVEENIAYNCRANELEVLPHIGHSWGDVFPSAEVDWDLVIASDILLYVKQYANLIKTLSFLLKCYKQKDGKAHLGSPFATEVADASGKVVQLQQPAFLMSWKRRLGKDEQYFFDGCQDVGLEVVHLGSRVYYITPRKTH
ncbi:Glycine/sarcosine N-methyltransferase protein [Dioscorea alata]|uniref:Glycine/sarcosine N-methyltransferase protein n=1 Tax=Dioscorea alata TaxID=55571 RepID=A0ACB7W711_DIOAL|nr:Glycine/sarcosine N-methyltransferase protein [Dioscorea alata]